jgi:hypothetical protein
MILLKRAWGQGKIPLPVIESAQGNPNRIHSSRKWHSIFCHPCPDNSDQIGFLNKGIPATEHRIRLNPPLHTIVICSTLVVYHGQEWGKLWDKRVPSGKWMSTRTFLCIGSSRQCGVNNRCAKKNIIRGMHRNHTPRVARASPPYSTRFLNFGHFTSLGCVFYSSHLL